MDNYSRTRNLTHRKNAALQSRMDSITNHHKMDDSKHNYNKRHTQCKYPLDTFYQDGVYKFNLGSPRSINGNNSKHTIIVYPLNGNHNAILI